MDRRKQVMHAQPVTIGPCVERLDCLIEPPKLAVVSNDQFSHGALLIANGSRSPTRYLVTLREPPAHCTLGVGRSCETWIRLFELNVENLGVLARRLADDGSVRPLDQPTMEHRNGNSRGHPMRPEYCGVLIPGV